MKEFVIGRLSVPVRVVARAVVAAFLLSVVTATVTVLSPRKYAAGFTMVPQVSDAGNSGLSSIASQLGVKLGSVDLTQTPLFYSDLLASRAFQKALAGSTYSVETPDGRRDTVLFEWLKAPGATTAQRHERGALILREKVSVSSSARSGIVRFTVTVKDSSLARQVAQRALFQIDSFNLRTKQSQARAERIFLESRADSIRLLLRESEEELVRFDNRNRAPTLSAGLRTERERILRDNRVLDNVYQLVRQQLERSRMEEVRNTPVVTVVEEVSSPSWPERRFLLYKTVATAFAVGIVWVALFVLLAERIFDGLLPSGLTRRLLAWLGGTA